MRGSYQNRTRMMIERHSVLRVEYANGFGLGHQQKVGIQVGRSEKVSFYKGTFRAQTRYDRTFSQFFGTF